MDCFNGVGMEFDVWWWYVNKHGNTKVPSGGSKIF